MVMVCSMHLLIPKPNNGKYQLSRGKKLNDFVRTLSSINLDNARSEILKDKDAFLEDVIQQINKFEDFNCNKR